MSMNQHTDTLPLPSKKNLDSSLPLIIKRLRKRPRRITHRPPEITGHMKNNNNFVLEKKSNDHPTVIITHLCPYLFSKTGVGVKNLCTRAKNCHNLYEKIIILLAP